MSDSNVKLMKAAVFNGPFNVSTQLKPIPIIEDATDVIVKVKYLGLCGSDLHYYRDSIPSKPGQIMGHEFVGTIVSKGTSIKDSDFKIGDDVISTFTIQCGECWYCKHGYSGTCDKTNTFGKVGLQGGQAEFVRVPYALSTLVHKPINDDSQVDDAVYVLMSDIFVTGYFGVKKILNHFKSEIADGFPKSEPKDLTILQLGAGPVGLCALKILKHFGFEKVIVIDGVEERLQKAKAYGASETINYQTENDKLSKIIAEETDCNGFDAVLEIVGTSAAIKTAFDSVRRNGFVASVGMGHDPLPFNGLECYVKSLNISFGRCHAWSLFKESLKVFELLKLDLSDLIDEKPKIDDSERYYDLFEKHQVGKVVFDLTK